MKLLYSTADYNYLAAELLKEEGNEFIKGNIERKTFPDGERYIRIADHVTGSDCAILSGTCSDANTLEVFDLASTLVNQGANKLTLIIPYYGYATMEKAGSLSGEVITAKTRANLLASIPKAAHGNDIKIVELHNDAIAYYFNDTPVKNINTKAFAMKACVELAGTEFVLATTDVGRAKAVEYIQRAFQEKGRSYKIETAFAYKRRNSGSNTEITGVNADVQDKIVVIYDDMVRTGGSLAKAAKVYRNNGAKDVFAVITHGVLPGGSMAEILSSGAISKVALTNSHPNAIAAAELHPAFVRLYSIAGLLSRYA